METKGRGFNILLLGILSVICCSVLGPFAALMGNNAMAEATDPGERNLINIGRILGIIGTVLLFVSIVFLIWLVFTGGLALNTGAGAGGPGAGGAGSMPAIP